MTETAPRQPPLFPLMVTAVAFSGLAVLLLLAAFNVPTAVLPFVPVLIGIAAVVSRTRNRWEPFLLGSIAVLGLSALVALAFWS